MKKLLLILTLACAGANLRAENDALKLDLFAMIGLQDTCDLNDILNVRISHKQSIPELVAQKKASGVDVDGAGLDRILDRIAKILTNYAMRREYLKLWCSFKENNEEVDPFQNDEFLSELGMVEVATSLELLEGFLSIQVAGKAVVPVTHRLESTPPINIPVSPVNGRKSVESFQDRPQSRTEVFQESEEIRVHGSRGKARIISNR